MDPAHPPASTNYDLHPGFWYALAGGGGGACVGDLNGDGALDAADLALFAGDFGLASCPGCAGDLDRDDDSDGTDLEWLVAAFGPRVRRRVGPKCRRVYLLLILESMALTR